MKYVFTFLIYLFIFWIARLIYLDINIMYRFRPPAKGNQPYLKLINQRDQLNFKVEESYSLSNETSIGRSARNDIVLQDPFISSEHARIILGEGTYFLEDLKSKNGTYMNGSKMTGPMPLRNGDRISFGLVEFLFVSDQK
ncbi:FHA domain-containing protein [Candidatus Formimonas warabiya]|uniref:FHA domain-containing protein n=1 Tax=Formimonas warabiya TaxID=1761012 RepID=A0A3G1KUE8_FORW1|nr:FHA domain-containing protein [Candidatus Formimonas warabiya]ATW26072.1 FHA domain-containing protein [Candidatus Formimonas warabiya]